ncbi:MAG TPA: zinc-ribbon domain-containing protein, partial [Desulfobacteraceae bacterium]|nr:zinc-ribbon domain-containing protein [Desulfobacteraceae bacterium]
IEDYLKQVIVSRFNDHLGENLDSLLNMPGKYDDLSMGLQKRLQDDFTYFGLALNNLYITSITPPPDVQKAIDDKSRLSVLKDLDGLIKLKAAMAMEKASESTGDSGSGLGMGLGFMMPAMFAESFRPKTGQTDLHALANCPDCGHAIPKDAKFCPDCGHQQLVFNRCIKCGKNLAPNARFCSRCGHPAEERPGPVVCNACKTENLPGASFCNNCGEKLA